MRVFTLWIAAQFVRVRVCVCVATDTRARTPTDCHLAGEQSCTHASVAPVRQTSAHYVGQRAVSWPHPHTWLYYTWNEDDIGPCTPVYRGTLARVQHSPEVCRIRSGYHAPVVTEPHHNER